MNKSKFVSTTFFIAAVAGLSVIFYNYPQNLKLGYAGIAIAIMCLIGASIMPD